MTSLWWRSWHGAPTDSKWLAIAKKANVAPGIVSAVAWALFDHASQQDSARGCVEGFDCESYAAFSGFEEEIVERTYDAICAKLAEDGKLVSWESRQPKREDISTDRVQRYRERNAMKRNVTHGNAILDKIRLDKKEDRVIANAMVDEFEKFWKAYPNRGASNPRKPASEKFAKLLKSGINPPLMILAAAIYAGECEKLKIIGTDKVAQAITWLNQERFNDYAGQVKTPEQEQVIELDMARRGYEWRDGKWVKTGERCGENQTNS